MESQRNTLGPEALQFFGKINASVSHELKNCLAIINENAGLLKDLGMLAQKGRPVSPERMATIADRIQAQVARGDEILRRMNAFAHSADSHAANVSIGELVSLMAGLYGRFAARREATIEVEPSESPVYATTDPFLLSALVAGCLDRALEAVGRERLIRLSVENGNGSVCIRIATAELIPEADISEREEKLLAALNAKMSFAGGIQILLNQHAA